VSERPAQSQKRENVKVTVFIKRSFCSTRKALRHGSHSFIQLHQGLTRKRLPDGASKDQGGGHLIAAYYSFIYLERMSRPSWLTYSRRFTHISGHPSAAGRAQDRESSPVKDQRSIPLYHATNSR